MHPMGAAPRDTERCGDSIVMTASSFQPPSLLAVMGSLVLGAAAPSDASGLPTPWANEVLEFDPGVGGVPGYDFAPAILGEPSRFTGVGFFPSVVSPFSSPYMPDEIVSIGAGGWITVRFEQPIADHPDNPFGIDFLIFGNTAFIDGDYPNGLAVGLFSDDGGVVEVSADGRRWVALPGLADGLFPTVGYLDSGPFDEMPGTIPSDFTRPVDPTLTLDDFLGLDTPAIVALYDGSGGGAGFDLAGTGLTSISFVRISVPKDSQVSVEIDALAAVTPGGTARFGDLNGDGIVDGADLGLLLGAWDTIGPGDLNGDGVVDGADLGLLLGAFNG